MKIAFPIAKRAALRKVRAPLLVILRLRAFCRRDEQRRARRSDRRGPRRVSLERGGSGAGQKTRSRRARGLERSGRDMNEDYTDA